MEFLQTYETTIRDQTGTISVTVLTIPSRTFLRLAPAGLTPTQAAQQIFDGDYQPGTQDIPALIAEMLFDGGDPSVMNLENNQIFANYVANAPIIPFEQSPLSTESLAGIALKASKAGTVSVGSTVGFLSAAGHPGFLLITVPMGIVLCGASVSLAK